MTSVAFRQDSKWGTRLIYKRLLYLGALICLSIVVYFDTWRSMVAVWQTPTYSHGFIVPLATIWLIYQQRKELLQIPSAPSPIALPLIAIAGLAWLAGNVGGVNVLMHFGVVFMIVSFVPIVFGWSISRRILIPLLLLFFAVPFGEFLVPIMMDWTASVTIFLVGLMGIPIYREGLSFILPSGSWAIIEECSGQRYLIAALPLAFIYAQLTYRSNYRKWGFVLATAAVALVANWLRAFGIVMLGHFSGMTLATGVDHLIYGWLFFGIIMLLMFWIGRYWSDLKSSTPIKQKDQTAPIETIPAARSAMTFIAAASLLIAWPIASATLQSQSSSPLNLSALSWDPLNAVSSETPAFSDEGLPAPFIRTSEQITLNIDDVNIWIGAYDPHLGSGEMIHHSNRVRADRTGPWKLVESRSTQYKNLQSIQFLFRRTDRQFLAHRSFLVNDRFVGSASQAKLHQAVQVLRGRGGRTMVIIAWTDIDRSVSEAAQKLNETMAKVAQQLTLAK